MLRIWKVGIEIMDKVSVIVPVYNVEPYIRQCLDSIVHQTYPNLEVLIVDDGSPDNCGAICDEYEREYDFVKVFHKQNGGLSSARNMGLDNATGEWILFVDSDDWCELNYVEKMVCGKSEDNFKVDVIISSSIHETSAKESRVHQIMEKEGIYCDKNLIDIMQAKSFCITFKDEKKYGIRRNSTNSAPWDKLYRRKIINDNKLKYSEDVKVHEDRLFNLQYFSYVKCFKYVDAKGYNYRYVGESITKKYDINRIEKVRLFSTIVYEYCVNNKSNAFMELAICLGGLQIFNGIRYNLSIYRNRKERKEKRKLFLEVLDWPIMKELCTSLDFKDIYEPKYKLIFLVLKCKSYFLLSMGTRLLKRGNL